MDQIRKLVAARVAAKGLTLKSVSRELGRNDAYLHQFINRRTPKVLPEIVRERLAEILDVDEEQIGGAHHRRSSASEEGSDMVLVPIHEVQASAGSGMVVSEESEVGQWPFPRPYLRNSIGVQGISLAIIEVIGDSMEPTLRSGDRIMIDQGDKNIAIGGIFALNDGDHLVVKRVEKIPNSRPAEIMLISDNPIHGRYQVPADSVRVAGRAVWVGRRL